MDIASLKRMSSGTSTTVSVIVPVYNEIDTVEIVLTQILEVRIPNIEFELIVVESNSADGTREAVSRFAGVNNVNLIFQSEALGKGNAVRAGLASVQGDIVIIQDADLEYDVSDYSRLLTPILNGSAEFVLGTRTKNGWKIREMPNERLASLSLNLGHSLLTTFFNVLFQTKLKDPFTMYKVFRTSAINGLEFESNRFDFDWELVGKLVRKGHVPIEVPVSYHARGFALGKKVRPFRDPLTWIWAALKYRVVRIQEGLPN